MTGFGYNLMGMGNVLSGGVVRHLEEVFAERIFLGNGTGTSSTQDIDIGDVDIATEGGMTWIFSRDSTDGNFMFSPTLDVAGDGGVGHRHKFDDQGNADTSAKGVTAWGTDNFTLLGDDTDWNANNKGYYSYSFRKSPKFFDIVQYTGNGSGPREIAHSLGQAPGFMMIKALDRGVASDDYDWITYHRNLNEATGVASPNKLILGSKGTLLDRDGYLNDTAPGDAVFTVGDHNGTNHDGTQFMALLWGHNTDGGFGAAGDQDIIKCSFYEGNDAASRHISVGFKTSWVLIIYSEEGYLRVYSNNNSYQGNNRFHTMGGGLSFFNNVSSHPNQLKFTDDGFHIIGGENDQGLNNNTKHFLYVAIREGTKEPSAGTEIYKAINSDDNDDVLTGLAFRPDYGHLQDRSGGAQSQVARVFGNSEYSADSATAADWATDTGAGGAPAGGGPHWADSAVQWDHPFGKFSQTVVDSSDMCMQLFGSRVGALCVGGYIPTTTNANLVITHNLGVVPEMIWYKHVTDLTGSDENWGVEASAMSAFGNHELHLNTNDAKASKSDGVVAASTTTFTVGQHAQAGGVAAEGQYVYLAWATLKGVTKVGVYTGDGTANAGKTIDCGFSASARFILIKRHDAAGHWMQFDTVSGIASGNEEGMKWSLNGAAVTNVDAIDAESTGFIVNQESDFNVNVDGGEYLFLAIA